MNEWLLLLLIVIGGLSIGIVAATFYKKVLNK